MKETLDLDDFKIGSASGNISTLAARALAQNPLGPLAKLVGTWRGTGFNQIWRPFHDTSNPKQDRFLELNETTEVLKFIEIEGDIPNRGLLQADIELHGVTYLQKINDAHVLDQNGKPVGLHIEPGIWINIPATQNPQDPSTVARLATIPHGTSLVAQGTALTPPPPPTFSPVDITPFVINNPNNPVHFPEQNLSIPTPFRTPSVDIPNVTQALVNNPNLFLANGITGKNIVSLTILQISTSTKTVHPPSSGGGTTNIAFLDGTASGPNAQAAQMDAIFWIEEFIDNGVHKFQLQYSQLVLLNFNGLSWPHASVATLLKHDH